MTPSVYQKSRRVSENHISKKNLTFTMEIKTIKLSEKGQLVLPQAMRERAGFRPGATVVLIERDGRIFIELAERVAQKLENDFAAWDRLSDEALENFEKDL